jgi:hypothetical protein
MSKTFQYQRLAEPILVAAVAVVAMDWYVQASTPLPPTTPSQQSNVVEPVTTPAVPPMDWYVPQSLPLAYQKQTTQSYYVEPVTTPAVPPLDWGVEQAQPTVTAKPNAGYFVEPVTVPAAASLAVFDWWIQHPTSVAVRRYEGQSVEPVAPVTRVPTRFYLPASTAVTPISPAPNAGWTAQSFLGRAMTDTIKIGDALANVSINDADSTDLRYIFRQYISRELLQNQVITQSQAVKAQCRVSETNAGNNMFFAMVIRVIAANGSTVQKIVLSITLDDVEATTSLVNKQYVTTSAATGNYLTVAGDRLVIEIGMSGNPAGANVHDSTMRLGDSSATDLPEDDTSTTDNNPWVELADDLKFVPSFGWFQSPVLPGKLTQPVYGFQVAPLQPLITETITLDKWFRQASQPLLIGKQPQPGWFAAPPTLVVIPTLDWLIEQPGSLAVRPRQDGFSVEPLVPIAAATVPPLDWLIQQPVSSAAKPQPQGCFVEPIQRPFVALDWLLPPVIPIPKVKSVDGAFVQPPQTPVVPPLDWLIEQPTSLAIRPRQDGSSIEPVTTPAVPPLDWLIQQMSVVSAHPPQDGYSVIPPLQPPITGWMTQQPQQFAPANRIAGYFVEPLQPIAVEVVTLDKWFRQASEPLLIGKRPQYGWFAAPTTPVAISPLDWLMQQPGPFPRRLIEASLGVDNSSMMFLAWQEQIGGGWAEKVFAWVPGAIKLTAFAPGSERTEAWVPGAEQVKES